MDVISARRTTRYNVPMGLYSRFILPRLVDWSCSLKPSMRQREKVVPLAKGRVLEIGFGSGLNIGYYDSAQVAHVWGLDPSAEAWKLAQEAVEKSEIEIEFLEAGAESIPLESGSADSIVVTYSLCTIPDRQAALGEIRRVMANDGRLIFCEHGAAPDKSVRKWQNRINPIWKLVSGGCNLNLDIPKLISEGGFSIDNLETMYLPGFKPATFNYWGVAR